MKNNISTGFFLVLMCFFLCVFNNGFAQSYTTKERVYWLSMIWKDMSTKYCNPQRLDSIKWDSLFTNYIPLSIGAEDDYEYYSLLERFMAMTSDGHTELEYQKYMRSQKMFDYLPIDIEMIADKFYISAIEEKNVDNIPIGSEILRVNNILFSEYLGKYVFPYVSASTKQNRQRKALAYFSRGVKNASLIFQIRTPKGEKKEINLKYNLIANGIKKSDMVAIHSSNIINYRRTDSYLVTDSCNRNFFYFRLDGFGKNNNVTELIKSQEENILKSDYIVLDLRYNTGGNELKADSLLMCFLDIDTLKTYASLARVDHAYYAAMGFGHSNHRDYYDEIKLDTLAIDFLLKKDLPLFKQPLFILIGDRTLSAAEDILITLKMNYPQRATLIGTPTGGSTGAPFVRQLPHHDVYYRICARKPLLPKGLFDNGIHPDFYYEPTIDDFIRKEDLFNYVAKIYTNHHESK